MSTSATCIALDRRNSSQKTHVHIPKSGLPPFFISLSTSLRYLSSVFLYPCPSFFSRRLCLVFCPLFCYSFGFILVSSLLPLFIFLPFSCLSFCRLSLLECDTVFTSNFSVVAEEVTVSRQGSTRHQAPPKRR